MAKTNIYEYTDFRNYLKDVFKEQKDLNNSFSHRYAAVKLGLSTSNFLWLVMQGKRNLNPSHCLKLSELFKHTPKESDYFENMVLFGQAKTHREKDRHFTRMTALRKNSNVGRIEERHYTYLSNWYNPVVRELITRKNFKNNFSALAKRVMPRISESQAKKSVALLLELGFIKEKGGRFVQNTPIVSTGPEVSSLAAINFHRTMGHLAIESLDSLGKNERNITACLVGLSKESYKKAVDAIAECRSRILAIAEEEQDAERVFAVNFQCFPVSTKEKEEERL
jgi:uncharacterized protein (TIGR02147 family)